MAKYAAPKCEVCGRDLLAVFPHAGLMVGQVSKTGKGLRAVHVDSVETARVQFLYCMLTNCGGKRYAPEYDKQGRLLKGSEIEI